MVASFVPLYEFLGRGADPGGGVRYLPVAYCVAWVGIALSVVVVGVMVVEKIRYRRRIAWAPLVAVPLVAESWLLGFLLAVVLVSV
ncbi:hypothetical protein ACQP0C_40485 [Nocardia sp. CA-129566]|uniref:hypothetical protein n=1 Tax=Nocardia sp. CA-129566 TaxID=3239976 RepID=UPI003D96C182